LSQTVKVAGVNLDCSPCLVLLAAREQRRADERPASSGSDRSARILGR
jgi:hypothetical protein